MGFAAGGPSDGWLTGASIADDFNTGPVFGAGHVHRDRWSRRPRALDDDFGKDRDARPFDDVELPCLLVLEAHGILDGYRALRSRLPCGRVRKPPVGAPVGGGASIIERLCRRFRHPKVAYPRHCRVSPLSHPSVATRRTESTSSVASSRERESARNGEARNSTGAGAQSPRTADVATPP